MAIFVGTLFSHVSKNKTATLDFTKIVTADLNFPRQELSNGGLGIVVTPLVCWQLDFSCASR